MCPVEERDVSQEAKFLPVTFCSSPLCRRLTVITLSCNLGKTPKVNRGKWNPEQLGRKAQKLSDFSEWPAGAEQTQAPPASALSCISRAGSAMEREKAWRKLDGKVPRCSRALTGPSCVWHAWEPPRPSVHTGNRKARRASELQ